MSLGGGHATQLLDNLGWEPQSSRIDVFARRARRIEDAQRGGTVCSMGAGCSEKGSTARANSEAFGGP